MCLYHQPVVKTVTLHYLNKVIPVHGMEANRGTRGIAPLITNLEARRG